MEFQYEEEPEYPFFNDLKKCVVQFFNLSIALFFSVILLRLIEVGYIIIQNHTPEDIWKVIGISLLFDIIFLTKILPFLFIPYLLVFFNTKNKSYIWLTFGVFSSILIAINLLLIKYYATALVPLGADLFGYSVDEIVQITGAGAVIDAKTLVLFIVPFIIFWTLSYFTRHKTYVTAWICIIVLAAGIIVSYGGVSALPGSTIFKTDYSYNLSVNKVAFFFEKSISHFADDEPPLDIYAGNYYDNHEDLGRGTFRYINANYPFLRADETEDVLGPLFKIDSTQPPNIIIIQVEGLGRAFSGPDAYLRSFTPFLDTLASKGLYFTNFLASQGRTFASLPSIMGSLPFGKQGFNELAGNMPSHLTLPRILKKNGYATRFYCGVDLAFDNQNFFLKKQGFDHIVSEPDFGASVTKSPAYRGFSWGYADQELVVKTLEDEKLRQGKPFMTYIQTLSMHSPFLIPGQERFLKLFEKHLSTLDFDNEKKNDYRKYKNVYSTILYTDQALAFFFKEYSKMPAYHNTIFIITGDHRLPEIPLSTKIDRYHVPLLIYSPLLKKAATVRSVSSHLDITPSLVAFLKNNYRLNTPSAVAWVGSGLDTARALRNIHSYPLMQTKNDFHDFVSGLYFLHQNEIFSIHENMNIERLQDDIKFNELRSAFDQQKNKNERFSRELKLIPDSLALKFK